MNFMESTASIAVRQSAPKSSGGLSTLRFDNRFTRQLPGDPDPINRRRQVPGACYSFVNPTPVRAPRLVAYSREVADLLNLSDEACQSERFAQVFTGNRLLPGM
jgi:serine/tyrosine/threonine adenylyltransferase